MVSVLIVTYNSAAHLERCLESVLAQDYARLELVIVDNASTDGTRDVLARYERQARILYNDCNQGFAGGQNQAIRQAYGDWLLVLNPDVVLRPDFVSRLVSAGRQHPEAGTVCGKLLRWTPGGAEEFSSTIDCAGMHFLPNLRHLDRGAEQADRGQFEREEYVFGASGAAALYRRKMVRDISIRGEFFDEDFFTYREDADLAWRAQLMGWKCMYTPRAVGWHVRRVTPERRERLPLEINWHSVKNRFLMRTKNASRPLMRHLLLPVLLRDAMVFGYALLVNPKLISALRRGWNLRANMREKRRLIQARRRVPDEQLLHWFSGSQRGMPIGEGAAEGMKIAIVGTRGIPARYGGFETLAEKLAPQLADRGHQVRVYCRKAFTRPDDVVDPRIRRVILPSISRKHLDTFISGLISAIHVAFSDADAVLICNVANSPFAWIPRLFGKPTALNVDGLDRTRRKWGLLARAYLYFCELISVIAPNRVITDANVIRDYYRQHYGKASTVIGYGAEAPPGKQEMPFPLPRGRFILYVSRLEKENNPEMVVRAYGQVRTNWPLVMVGWNPYDPGYIERLKALADPRVIFAGPVYGESYWALQKNSGIYVFSGEVGGIHPALVEAMCAHSAVLYLDTPANRETADDAGIPFTDEGDLAERMRALLAGPETIRMMAARAGARAGVLYRWERVAEQYEELFAEMTGKEVRHPASESQVETAA